MPNRYEEEIEEIIDRGDRSARRTERVSSVIRRVSISKSALTFSSGNVMLAGFAFIIVGLILSSFFVLLATIGALLLLIGYIMYFTRSRRQPYQKRWRGRVVDFQDNWPNRFRRFCNRRR